jgi:Flp pilus assembly protein TadB/Mg-chelatase subunit ChlD
VSRGSGGRNRAWRLSATLLAAFAVLLLSGPAALAAASPIDEARELLGARVPAGAQQLQLTAPPRRQGEEVILRAQVPGVPGRGNPRVVAVDADRQPLDAVAAITGAKDAPTRTAVLLVDTSGSMSGDGMDAARKAAEIYADTVGKGVRVGLVAFSDAATVVTPPTTDRAALRKGIRGLSAGGETALYDGLVLAAHKAGRRGNVVLLSDGGDTASHSKFRQALHAVSSAGVRVDVIAFNTVESDRTPLERIASWGRGRIVQAADAAGLGKAFAAAAAAVPLDITMTVRPRPAGSRDAAVLLMVGGLAYASLVHLPPGPALPPPAPTAVQPAVERVAAPGSPLTPTVLAGALFAVLALTAAALFWPRDPEEVERQHRQRALRAYGSSPMTNEPDAGPSAVSSAAAGVLQVSERMVAAGNRQGAITLRLDRAGLTLLPHEWLVLRTSIVVVAGAAGLLLTQVRWLGLLLGALLGWVATEVWFRVKQSRRCQAFAEQLPDTLQVVSSSLRSGFSLPQALAAAQESGAQPMAAELGRALAAARIGIALEDELDQMARRMRSEDWRMAVMAIRIQRSVGGSLAEVLATTAKTLRERSGVTRQVRALSAEGRLSAYILLGLPVVVGLFLVAFRRPYVEPLWTTSAGLVMVAVAAVGMVVGTWWMFKVAKVEV